MTDGNPFAGWVFARMRKTGETYKVARAAVIREERDRMTTPTERLLKASYTSPCYVCTQPMPAERNIMWDRQHKRGRHLSCEPDVNPPAPPGIAQPQQRASADAGLQHAQHVFDRAPPVHKPGLLRLRVALAELAGLGCPLELFEATMGLAINDALHAHERHVQEALDADAREAGNGKGISLEDAGIALPAALEVLEASHARRDLDTHPVPVAVIEEQAREAREGVPLATVFANEDPKPATAYAGLSAWLDKKE